MKKTKRNTISKEPQTTAKVLSGGAFGRSGAERWIVQESPAGVRIDWVDGFAQTTFLCESEGYVKPTPVRTIARSVYDDAPTHAVEIWRYGMNGEFHVRIFAQID